MAEKMKQAAKITAINRDLLKACEIAVRAAEHIIRTCEADLEAGRNPSPFVKSCPSASLAECYAATRFVSQARAAIAKAKATEL